MKKLKCPCVNCITLPICKNKVIIALDGTLLDFIKLDCIYLHDYIWLDMTDTNAKRNHIIKDVFKIKTSDEFFHTSGPEMIYERVLEKQKTLNNKWYCT